jgi:hypothetical protein
MRGRHVEFRAVRTVGQLALDVKGGRCECEMEQRALSVIEKASMTRMTSVTRREQQLGVTDDLS